MSLSAAEKQRRYRERNDAGQERRQNIFVKEKRKTPAWYSDMKKKTYFSCQKGQQGELEERRKHVENIVTPSASPTHAITGPSDASNSHQVTHRQLESLKNESNKKRKVANMIQLSSY